MLRRDLTSKALQRKGKLALYYALFASASVLLGAIGTYFDDHEKKKLGLPTYSERLVNNARRMSDYFSKNSVYVDDSQRARDEELYDGSQEKKYTHKLSVSYKDS
ncbi:unnamed protein product [Gordionus sp. m RMFG-2023]